MKTDFTKVPIAGIDGKIEYKDLSKEIGNLLYKTTEDIGDMDLAREIYHEGEVDLTPANVQSLLTLLEKCHLFAYVKVAITEFLKPENHDTDK